MCAKSMLLKDLPDNLVYESTGACSGACAWTKIILLLLPLSVVLRLTERNILDSFTGEAENIYQIAHQEEVFSLNLDAVLRQDSTER